MHEERRLKRVNFDKFNDENQKGFDLITLEKVSPAKFDNGVPTKLSTWDKAISNSSKNSINTRSTKGKARKQPS